MIKIIGVGDNVVDKYIDLNMMFPGGNALNVAVLSHRYGANTAYIGCLGNDFAGKHILNSLEAEGIDVSHVKVLNGPTAYSRVTLVNGDRTFLKGDKGISSKIFLSEEDYEFIKQFDLIHTSVYSFIEELLPKLKQTGRLISFDYSDCFEMTYIKNTATYVDFAFFSGSGRSEEELKAFQKSISTLGPKHVLVTRGAEGALLYENGKYYKQFIIPINVVDTMGAGDSFISRYLVGKLNNEKIEEILYNSALAASIVCKYNGAFGYGVEIK